MLTAEISTCNRTITVKGNLGPEQHEKEQQPNQNLGEVNCCRLLESSTGQYLSF